MSCPHLNPKGNCAIVSDLAGQPVRPHFSACDFCSRADKATPIQSLNSVTVSIALSNLDWASERAQQILAAHGHLIAVPQGAGEEYQRLAEIESGHGVGSQIWRLLSEIGVHHDPTCDCLHWAEKLNAWGPAGCRLARAEIIQRLADQRKRYGWLRSVQAAVRAATNAGADLAAGRRPWLNPLDPYGCLVDEAIRCAKARLTAAPTGREGTASHGIIAGEITHAVPTLPPTQIQSKEEISAGSQPDCRSGADV